MDLILKGKYRIKYNENLIEILNQGGTSEITKIESRFMEVLKILIENNGTVVPREMIIEKVWDNYGGGDEGLTQAISYLRKILDDGNRTLIETISKKGYKLNSEISKWNDGHTDGKINAKKENKLQVDKRLIWAGVAIIALLVIFIIYSKIQSDNNTPTPKALNPDKHQKYDSTSVTPKPDSK